MSSFFGSYPNSWYRGWKTEEENPLRYLKARMIEKDNIRELYQTLGIEDLADIEQVRELYCNAKSQEIDTSTMNAFQILSNPITKTTYDQLLKRSRKYQDMSDGLDRDFRDWYNAAYHEEIDQIHDLLYQEFRDQKDLMNYVSKQTEEQSNITYQHIARFHLNSDSTMWRPDKHFRCSKQQLDIVKHGEFYFYYIQDSQDCQDYLIGSRSLILDVNKSTRLNGTRNVGTSRLEKRLLLNLPGYTWEYTIARTPFARLEPDSRTEYFSSLGDNQYTNPGLSNSTFPMIVRDYELSKRTLLIPDSLEKLNENSNSSFLQHLASYDNYLKDGNQRTEKDNDVILEDVRFTNPDDLPIMKAIYSNIQYMKTMNLYTKH